MKKSLAILLLIIPAPLFASQIWTSSSVCDADEYLCTGGAEASVLNFTLELADGTTTSDFTFDKNAFVSLTAILDPSGTATTFDFTPPEGRELSYFGWDAKNDYLFMQAAPYTSPEFCGAPTPGSCSGAVLWNGTSSTGYISGSSVPLDWQLQSVPVPAAAWLFGSALLGLGMMKRRKA